MKSAIKRWFLKGLYFFTCPFEVFLGNNENAKNVLIFSEHLNATYYISYDLPLRKLHEKGKVNFAAVSQNHVDLCGVNCLPRWFKKFRPDYVVLTRYGQPCGKQILSFFKEKGIPVIYHIDDDLLEVPETLGALIKEVQGATDIVDTRRYLLANSDLIYASTSALAELFHERFPDQPIFQGIYAPYLKSELKIARSPKRPYPVIGYMGSKGHQNDLELAVPALERLLDERPELHFEVFGSIKIPPALLRFKERITRVQVMQSYTNFLESLADLHWDVGLAPLEDEPFNRCKAPTKFIEYTAAGIPVIVNAVGEYINAIPDECARIIKNNDWYEALSEYLDDKNIRLKALQNAQAHCEKAFSLDALQAQLLTLLKQPDVNPDKGISRKGRIYKCSRERILFIANDEIPTLQLSFYKPLQTLVSAGDIVFELLSAEQIKKLLPEKDGTLYIEKYINERLDMFVPTVIVFCRYGGSNALAIVDYAQKNKIPAIYHIDDDLLGIPIEIGQKKFEYHNQPKRLEAVRYLLGHTTMVYCSTQKLLERLMPHGLEGRSVAGDVYCSGKILAPPANGLPFKIGYMGFDHAHYFELVLPALVDILNAYPDIQFELFGSIPKPDVLNPFGQRVTVIEPVKGYAAFMEKFASLGWAIGICPLADTPFNAVKADTKWVEYTSVGAAVIATRGTIYDKCCGDGCGIVVDGLDEWKAAFIQLIENPQLRKEYVLKAQRKVEEIYSVEALRVQVLEVIKKSKEMITQANPRPDNVV